MPNTSAVGSSDDTAFDDRIPWVRIGSRWRRFHDGGGRCSFGRLLPEHRPDPPLAWLATMIFDLSSKFDLVDRLQQSARRTDSGSPFEDPFPVEVMHAIRVTVFEEVCKRTGSSMEWMSHVATGQPFFLNFLSALGVLCNGHEMDAEYPRSLEQGVPLGIDETLPRNAHLFSPKTKYSIPFSDAPAYDCGGLNSESVDEHISFVEEQLQRDVDLGFRLQIQSDAELVKLLGAQPCRGKLSVASKHRGGTVERRLVYNNTANGGNARIRVRDLIEQPSLADLKVALKRSLLSRQPQAVTKFYAYLKFDYSKAHNRIKILAKDWKYQVVTWRGTHYVQPVGCFGTASIAYWCSRLLSYIKRLKTLTFPGDWLELLFADDSMCCIPLCAFWPHACCHLLFVVICGGLISWHKTSVGCRNDWVGFVFNGISFRCGISYDRALEIVQSLQVVLSEEAVSPAELAPVVHKLSWAVQALEWLRPWLQPLYRFLHGPPEHVRVRPPVDVVSCAQFLCDVLKVKRSLVPLELAVLADFEAASDASVSEDAVIVGGWLAPKRHDYHSPLSRGQVYWFSVVLDRDSCPWAYCGNPGAIVPAAELLGTLFLLLASLPRVHGHQFSVALPQTTDNQGNGYILSKCFTSKQPAASILMCISKLCLDNECLPMVQWSSRDQNTWADDLSKRKFENFATSRELRLDYRECLAWINERIQSEVGAASADCVEP